MRDGLAFCSVLEAEPAHEWTVLDLRTRECYPDILIIGIVTLQTRTATPDDLPQLQALWQERIVILSQADARFARLQPDVWRQQATDTLKADNHGWFVAAEPGATVLAGFIHGRLVDDDKAGRVGVMLELALDAHAYHGGLARRLWRTLEAWFTEKTVADRRLQVPRYRPVEQAFWRALGATAWNAKQDELKENDATWKIPPEMMWMTLSSGKR